MDKKSAEDLKPSAFTTWKSTLRLDVMNPQKERLQKKRRWITRAMAEDFSRRDVLICTVRAFFLHGLFLAAVTIGTIGKRTHFFFHLTKAIRDQFVEREFAVNQIGTQYGGISSTSEFWIYAEGLMLDAFYWDYYYDDDDEAPPTVNEDDKKILFENKLLGAPRIRQVRVKNDSCIIHKYLRKLVQSCYYFYSTSSEDKASFGPGKGTAWEYNTPEETQSVEHWGKFAKYGAGGFYVDLPSDRKRAAEVLKELKENLWINRGTRAVLIDFSLYNANINLFCICKLVMEFPPTGGIVTSYSFHTVHLLKYVNTADYITFGFEVLTYIMVIYCVVEKVYELMYFKWRYFTLFWTYVDMAIISMTIANVVFLVVIYNYRDPAIQKIKENPDQYGNLEYVAQIKVFHNEFGAVLLFFGYIKTFKYLNFNKTMGQLNNTLKKCALDILGFGVMFAIVFFAFAELGYLLFGNEVEDFCTFGTASFTLLRTILGDFNYQQIESANQVLAPLYFISFIFLVFFVLLNMFLAIINDTFSEVKTESAIAPDQLQMTDFLKKELYDMLQKLGWKIKTYEGEADYNATVQQIHDALSKCDFSDLEIEMFFARYNIDPKTEIRDYDEAQIIKELESYEAKPAKQEDAQIVHVHDFIVQQERLDQIEKTTQLLDNMVEDLLKKLEIMEANRKARTSHG